MTPTHTSRPGARFIPLLNGALGAAVALAAIGLSTGAAQAACAPGTPSGTCRVTVGGLQYDVTTFTGTQSAPSDLGTSGKFATEANGGVMPWWGGDGTLANQFASAVRSSFSTPNLFDAANTFSAGPLFAFNGSGPASFWAYTLSSTNPGVNDTIFTSMTNYLYSNPIVYAQATLYTPTPVEAPGPLPLFGAAAAFGFSRQLRKRIQVARLQVSSRQPRA